ncbi:MAG: phage tail protein [Gammaproteobacteria bacterium]|nr:phage tail protein [Gammaproteobacteria bacterium]
MSIYKWIIGFCAVLLGSAPVLVSASVVFALEGVSREPVELQSCSVVASVSEPIPLANNGTLRPTLVPSLPNWRALRCQRKAVPDARLRAWREQVEKGDEAAFRDVTLNAPDEPTDQNVFWNLQRAWPSRWWIACDRTVCRETLVLVFNDVRNSLDAVPTVVEEVVDEPGLGRSDGSAFGLVLCGLLLLVSAVRRRAGWSPRTSVSAAVIR